MDEDKFLARLNSAVTSNNLHDNVISDVTNKFSDVVTSVLRQPTKTSSENPPEIIGNEIQALISPYKASLKGNPNKSHQMLKVLLFQEYLTEQPSHSGLVTHVATQDHALFYLVMLLIVFTLLLVRELIWDLETLQL